MSSGYLQILLLYSANSQTKYYFSLDSLCFTASCGELNPETIKECIKELIKEEILLQKFTNYGVQVSINIEKSGIIKEYTNCYLLPNY